MHKLKSYYELKREDLRNLGRNRMSLKELLPAASKETFINFIIIWLFHKLVNHNLLNQDFFNFKTMRIHPNIAKV